jgi:hypothetical protein
MRDVDYTDDEGRSWRVRVPDDCPADRFVEGIPIGPPALASLGLPLAVEVRLHNQLFGRGLLTRRDVLRRPGDVFAALQAAYRVDVQTLQTLYLTEQGG